MNPTLTLATARRVLLQLKGDPRSIALILALPSAVIVLFYFVYWDNERLFSHVAVVMNVLFPMLLLFVVTSVSMQRERTSGTLERLMTTPLHRADIIVGYALAFSFFSFLQSVVLYLIGRFALGLENESPWWLTILASLVAGVVGVSLGLFASAFARTEFQAVQMMPALLAPQVLLCGLLLPRDQLLDVLRWISNVLPLSYATDAVTESAEQGLTAEVAQNLGICLVFGVAFLALAALTMPRKAK